MALGEGDDGVYRKTVELELYRGFTSRFSWESVYFPVYLKSVIYSEC